MEYRGILCKEDPGWGAYILQFEFKGSKYWIDATKEDDSLGRLVNDSTKGNATTKTMTVSNIPRVGIFAVQDINVGDEILNSYNKGGKNELPLEEEEQTSQFPIDRVLRGE